MTSIGYFGASDDKTIRIRNVFGGNRTLEAFEASEVGNKEHFGCPEIVP